MASFFSRFSPAISGDQSPARAAAPVPECFHCGLTMPPATDLWVEFDGARKPVCCIGCQSLFEVVVAGGMGDYYRERERRAHAH